MANRPPLTAAEDFLAEHGVPLADIPKLLADFDNRPDQRREYLLHDLAEVCEKYTGRVIIGDWPTRPPPQRRWDTEAELIAEARRYREMFSDDFSEGLRGLVRACVQDLVNGLRLLPVPVTPPAQASDLADDASVSECLGALDAIIREAEERAELDAEILGGFFSCTHLAKYHGVSEGALRKRLGERWRDANDGGWIEDDNRKTRDAKYLFRGRAVLPVISAMKRKTEASKNVRGLSVDKKSSPKNP